jgi:hypothetical protein
MHAEVERTLTGDLHFLRDVMTAGVERATTWNRLSYIRTRIL